MILTAKYIQHYIKDNKIDTTEPFELNLSYNQISSIEKDAFKDCNNLKGLNLSSNHITSIEKDTFKDCNNLEWLNLSSNPISSIEKDAFDDCKILKWLNLDGNRIPNIENKRYAPRIEILELIEKLKSLEVVENNGSISDLKSNNLSQIKGQDCDTITINHSIPLEKSSKVFEEIGKIRQNRPALHGSARDNFKKIAALWSAYLDTEVTIQDVGFMMSMLKAARHKNGDKNNMDNFFDGSNYIALAGDMLYRYLNHFND